MATAWLNKNDFDQAIADVNEAIRSNPTDANAYFNRGIGLGVTKRSNDRANGDYSEAIRLDPQLSAAYNNRGNAVRGIVDSAAKEIRSAFHV